MNRESRRVAVVGFDHMHAGDQIAATLSSDSAQLTAVWDSDRDRMARVGYQLGVDAGLQYTDLDRLMQETNPEVAVICSTTSQHREFVSYFAERGVHVLLEKPFASSTPDALAMAADAKARSVLLGVNWPLAWYPVHRTAHRLVVAGTIGDVREIHYYDGNRGPLFHTHGKREIDAVALPQTESPSWWYQASAGGGSLRDYLGYGATLATWFRGGELPTDVTARTHVAPGDEVDEQAVVIAAYPGGLSTFQTRWGTFTDPWSHQPYPRCGFVIVGGGGTIASFDFAEHVNVQTSAHPEGFTVPVDILPSHETGGLANFIHSLDRGIDLRGPTSWETSLAGQRIVEAAAESAATGRHVILESGDQP